MLCVMPWSGGYELLSWSCTRQNYISLLRISYVFHQWTEEFATQQQFQTGWLFLPEWNASQPRALDVTVISLQSNLIKASKKRSFALSTAEDRQYKQYAQKSSEVGFQLMPLAFESFGGFSETVRKILKRIATLTDYKFAAGWVVSFE